MQEKKGLFIIIVIAIAAVGIFFLSRNSLTQNQNTNNNGAPTGGGKTFALQSGKSFNTNGSATLSATAEGVWVSLSVSNTPFSSGVYPAFIHEGTCLGMGPVLYLLTPVSGGESDTLLSTSFENLRGQLPIAINVNKSNSELDVSVTCTTVDSL